MINKEIYEKLKPFEAYLSSAYYANYYRQLRRGDQMELRVIYKEIFGVDYTDSPNCNACVLTLLKKIGKEYFSYTPVVDKVDKVEDIVEVTLVDTVVDTVEIKKTKSTNSKSTNSKPTPKRK